MSLFSRNKNITSVKLLGTRTGEETGLLATYNFTVYIFWVQYSDGSAENVEISSSDGTQKQRLKKLLQMANMQESALPQPTSDEKTNSRSKSDVYADLKNIKDLFDAQIIPEKAFNSEKDRLLKELDTINELEAEENNKPEYNLIINRSKKRPWGESKIVVTIDNKERNDIDTDMECKLNLPKGEHTIVIKRAAIKSEKTVTIDNSHVCSIMICPEMFSLDMTVKYI